MGRDSDRLDVHYAKIVRHGGSQRIALAPALRRALNLRLGYTCSMYVKDGGVFIKKVNITDERRVR